MAPPKKHKTAWKPQRIYHYHKGWKPPKGKIVSPQGRIYKFGVKKTGKLIRRTPAEIKEYEEKAELRKRNAKLKKASPPLPQTGKISLTITGGERVPQFDEILDHTDFDIMLLVNGNATLAELGEIAAGTNTIDMSPPLYPRLSQYGGDVPQTPLPSRLENICILYITVLSLSTLKTIHNNRQEFSMEVEDISKALGIRFNNWRRKYGV